MRLPEINRQRRGPRIKIPNRNIAIPSYYEPLDQLPFDPHESELSSAYGARSSNALCAIVLTPIPINAAMPYNDVQYVLDVCRNDLGAEQGLIEIDTGRTKGGFRYIYNIVKSDMNDDEGMPFAVMVYTLNLNIDYRDFDLSVVGNFQEIGTTGIRGNMGMMVISKMMQRDPSDLMEDN